VSVFLRAEWRRLALLNYAADPALLGPLVPGGTELDAWSGETYVSLVGFLFLGTRVLGVSVPFHRDFEEVNLRFYVRRKGPEGWRRGVVFVKEIVPRFAIAFLARALYNENYVALPMGHEAGEKAAAYRFRHAGREHRLGVSASEEFRPLGPGSHEEFIAEHYWGYTRQRDGGTLEYEVTHPPWRVARADHAFFEGDAATLYGPSFAEPLSRAPVSAFLAEGSPITVSGARRL
jgi:uncharacterized protein YqjF (DUF2071 family)